MKSTIKVNCEQCGKHLKEADAEAYYISLDNYIIVCPQCLKKLLKDRSQ